MLSGIGDGDHLKRTWHCGTKADLKGVGRNLQDHLAGCGALSPASVPISLYNYMSPSRRVRWRSARYVLFRTGPLASAGIEATAYRQIASPISSEPDLKLFISRWRSIRITGASSSAVMASSPISMSCGRPAGAGSAWAPPTRLVAAGDRPEFPLAVESDLIGLRRRGIQIAREVFGQKSFDPYRDEEIAPGPGVGSNAEIDAYIRSQTEADYHSVGTCKMGSDEMAVVDSRLRVHGVEGLRVVDASIMPTLVGGNTNMPVIMIAEKASDMIMEAI